jgi:transglutaminase-like putative cysteine protease
VCATIDRHVTLAWGRDYDDVCPIKGVILGGGERTVSVAVDVVPAEPPGE